MSDKKKLLVVIDPGHTDNTYNAGAVKGYYESKAVYDLSLYEKAALEKRGIDVILTRERNQDPGLYERGQMAVKKGHGYANVVFESNHSNAFNGKAYGVTIIRSAHLPVFPVYALLRLGCRLFGGFDPEEASAAGAMARCDTPVLFLHGEDDRFVPCAMGRENYACCRAADKTLLTFPAAGHGMSYMADRERYLAAVTDFLGRVFGEEYGTKTTHTFGI